MSSRNEMKTPIGELEKNNKNMNNKQITLFLATMCLCGIAVGQCYSEKRNKGMAAYNAKNYKAALGWFSEADRCPDKPRTNDIDDRINECTRKRKAERDSRKPAHSNPSASSKAPECDVLYTRLKTTCVNNVRGGNLIVGLSIVNMRNIPIELTCVMKSQYGSEWAAGNGDFSIEGRPGAKQTVIATTDEEDVEVSLFVPFSAINWGGSLDMQTLTTLLTLSARTSIRSFTQKNDFYVSPVSMTVNGSFTSVDLPCDYKGGRMDLDIRTCGQSVVWSGLPSWISAEEATVRIAENTDELPRSATISVTPYGGGNTVAVTVTQQAYSENDIAKAVINEIFVETVVHASLGVKVLKTHVDFEIENAKGKDVKAYALFYTENDDEPLRDESGNPISGFTKGSVRYNSARFDDCQINVYYAKFTKAVNAIGVRSVRMRVGISIDQGSTWLAISEPITVEW